MIRKVFLLLALVVSLKSFSQQLISIDDYLPLLHHTNSDLLFNKTAVNPSFSEDSTALSGRMLLQERWIGFHESPGEMNFVLQGNVPETRHYFGMELEWWGNSQITSQKLRLNYSYLIPFNGIHSLKVGVNLDMASLMWDEIQGLSVDGSRSVFFMPNIHLGISYTWMKRSFGLAYGNLFPNTLEGTRVDYRVNESRLILSYLSWQDVGPAFRFRSQLMLNTDFNGLYYFIATTFTYKKFITGGVFFNSQHKSKGLLFSARIRKRYEIGYQFYFNEMETQLLGGHSLFLGYRMDTL